MVYLNKAQRRSVFRVWQRTCEDGYLGAIPYREFRRANVEPGFFDCVMVRFCNMWLGVELDGYTHS